MEKIDHLRALTLYVTEGYPSDWLCSHKVSNKMLFYPHALIECDFLGLVSIVL